MSWDSFPLTYRAKEVRDILAGVRAGECVSVIGLSGAGKSNLLGFLAQRGNEAVPGENVRLELVDCNRLAEPTAVGLYGLMAASLGADPTGSVPFDDLYAGVGHVLERQTRALCFLIDRFDIFLDPLDQTLAGNLRALRDGFKYQLTYVVASRRPLDPHTELAELFYARTIRLGPLSENDARWNVERYADRVGAEWDEAAIRALLEATRGYPSLLRAACEAHFAGAGLDIPSLAAHPAVQRRVREFWADGPHEEEISLAGLDGHPLLEAGRGASFDTKSLTAKEKRLYDHLFEHAGEVCEKDDLIRAVWPEDKVFDDGVRDDSLAQIVRRLRVKIEPDPSNPRYLETVPGRGYMLKIS